MTIWSRETWNTRSMRGVGLGMTYPAYRTVHTWLSNTYGKATEHTCVDCGKQAGQWSYNGSSDREIRSPTGMPYSPDLTAYSPRCVRCHKRHDGHTGETNYQSQVSNETVAHIVGLYWASDKRYGTIARLAREYNVDQRTLNAWIHGRARRGELLFQLSSPRHAD